MDYKKTIKDYLRNEIIKHDQVKEAFELKDNEPLVTGNLTSSIDIVKLAVFIETTFGIDVVDEEIRMSDYDTINNICTLITNKLEQRPLKN